jgi:hypothetical protein
MKVTRLQASNILRLVAVDIKPEGALVTIGGKNGAGKSSAMNSIAMALGGQALCPTEPIRTGESDAEIRVDFDTDLVVTRKFSRERVPCSCASFSTPNAKSEDASLHADTCNWRNKVFGETKSTLIVANKAGAKYPSPQALLDRLVGRLAFDPLAFKDDKDQATTLRRLVNLDVSAFDKARADAAAGRAMQKKTLAIKQAQLAAMPKHEGVPDAETPITTEKLVEAERLRKLAEEAERAEVRASDQHSTALRQADSYRDQILALETKIQELSDKRRNAEAVTSAALRALDAAKITAEAARAVVPDVTAISAELAATEATNAKVRANQRHAEAETEVKKIEADVAAYQKLVDEADRGKQQALDGVQFPVDGLGLSDVGVTFGGIPFAQAATNEQLRVSVAIGLALNPTLKVLLIRNGNVLDEDSLALVAKQAEDAGAQIWVEWVAKDKNEVQVFIEDGHVA